MTTAQPLTLRLPLQLVRAGHPPLTLHSRLSWRAEAPDQLKFEIDDGYLSLAVRFRLSALLRAIDAATPKIGPPVRLNTDVSLAGVEFDHDREPTTLALSVHTNVFPEFSVRLLPETVQFLTFLEGELGLATEQPAA